LDLDHTFCGLEFGYRTQSESRGYSRFVRLHGD
jgi:hypothetical protein